MPLPRQLGNSASRARPRIRPWVPAVLLCLACAACSASTRLSVLNFFFDGVPDPLNPRFVEFQGPPVPRLIRAGQLTRTVTTVWHTHKPYEDRKCDECHIPRKTNISKAILSLQELTSLRAPIQKLCFRCHELPEKRYGHAPALVGQCVTCHHPHTSPNQHLLLAADSRLLCTKCHTESVLVTRSVHASYGERACTACHNAHSADNPLLLRVGWQQFATPPPEVLGPPLPPRYRGR